MSRTKVTNDTLIPALTQETAASPTAKTVGGLVPGDRFKGAVVDMQPNQITIRLENGQLLTAKALLTPNAHIGDENIFLVKESFKGQVLLEMLPQGGVQLSQAALEAAGLPKTQENLELVKLLMDNHLTPDPSTLQKAAFFRYAQPQTPLEHVLFLLTENFPAEVRPIQTLQALASGNLQLQADLQELATGLLSEPVQNQLPLLAPLFTEENLAEVSRFLAGSDDAPTLPLSAVLQRIAALPPPERQEARQKLAAELQKNLFLNLTPAAAEGQRKELAPFFRDLQATLEHLQRTAASLPVPAKPELAASLRQARDNVEFSGQIQQYREYMQIPFLVHGQPNQGELYVFKNRKGQSGVRGEATVLIAVDLSALGHLEALVNKREKSLSIQIRGDSDGAVKLLSQQATALRDALTQAGYVVTNLSVKKLKESFRLTQPVEVEPEETGPKRYSFDMRV